MTEFFYPSLSAESIALFIKIKNIYANNPTYFDSSECPYPQELIEVYKGTAAYHDFDSHAIDEVPSADNILAAVNKLNKELADYGRDQKYGEGVTASDRNTYFRLSVAMIEKLITLREKISGIAEFERFSEETINIMDRVLTTEQKSVVLDKLKGIIKDESRDRIETTVPVVEEETSSD